MEMGRSLQCAMSIRSAPDSWYGPAEAVLGCLWKHLLAPHEGKPLSEYGKLWPILSNVLLKADLLVRLAAVKARAVAHFDGRRVHPALLRHSQQQPLAVHDIDLRCARRHVRVLTDPDSRGCWPILIALVAVRSGSAGNACAAGERRHSAIARTAATAFFVAQRPRQRDRSHVEPRGGAAGGRGVEFLTTT